MDQWLQLAASKAGRSVSEEIEYRLFRSFYDDNLSSRFLGSHVGGELLRLIRAAMAIESVPGPGEDWAEDRKRAENLRIAINVVISVVTNLPQDLPPPEERLEGLRTAANLLARSSMGKRLPEWLSNLAEGNTG